MNKVMETIADLTFGQLKAKLHVPEVPKSKRKTVERPIRAL